jgi:O-antigen ligase
MNNIKFLRIYFVGFLIILALPLLSSPPWFSPSDWGKVILFRIIFSLLLFLFVLQKIWFKDGDKTRANTTTDLYRCRLPVYILLALGGIYFLATIFSVDPLFSLWGSPERSGGFINFALYIAFALLAFFALKQRDWRKIWDWAIFIGIIVSVIAVFQFYGILSKALVHFNERPPSTIGGPIFLAIYLMLLSFLALSFGIKERRVFKKTFYLFSFLFMTFIAVFLTQTRAVMAGFGLGIIYFLFFYPRNKISQNDDIKIIKRSKKKSVLIKTSIVIIIISTMVGIYYVVTHPTIPDPIKNVKILSYSWFYAANRLTPDLIFNDQRTLGWQVALSALKEKPILGWGPENLEMGFEKFYNPRLSSLSGDEATLIGWWDRAHNFLLDISTTAGIPALLIYLALFGVLFWQLQQLKSADKNADGNANKTLIAHGIQATFIAYLVANFFSFDTFSSYLISFLLIAYTLHLIRESSCLPNKDNPLPLINGQLTPILEHAIRHKKIIIGASFVLLIWFIYFLNIKPFNINTQINIADYLSQNKMCDEVFARLDRVLPEKSFLDAYSRIKYIEAIKNCAVTASPEKNYEYTKKGVELLKQETQIRPLYVRGWIFLGSFETVLANNEKSPEVKQGLIKEANSYFKKAAELSPHRLEVFSEWLKLATISGDYNKIAGIYEKLIELNPNEPSYYASLAFVYRELGEYGKAKQEALKFLELSPNDKDEVNKFLETLP